MKKVLFFVILFISLFWNPQKSKAEELSLGLFSTQKIDNYPVRDINLKIDDYTRQLTANEQKNWIKEREILTYNSKYASEIENYNLCAYNKSITCRLVFSSIDENHIQKISQIALDKEALKKFVDDLSRSTDKDPENAKLQIGDGRVSSFALSKDGIKLDKNKSLEILINYYQNNNKTGDVNLAYDTLKPEISSDSIDNLGIDSLIGEGRSNFRGSPKNRIFNINVGAGRFNGILIKPGEEFSFVKVLGPVDGEHGYLPELVIKKDKTEPEFGGGICQVSTTAFRAAIYSGLKITARRNHAYPVQYYNPQGMDSTVYIPRPDLRFINNTPAYILIQTKIEGTELVFDFYGTNDGRKTNIIGPTITERNPDGSMKATFTQQVFDKNNTITFEDVFNSSYDSPSKYPHPGQILTEKPKDWTKKQWENYKKANHQ